MTRKIHLKPIAAANWSKDRSEAWWMAFRLRKGGQSIIGTGSQTTGNAS